MCIRDSTYAAGIGGGTGGTGNVTIRGGIITVNGVEWGGAGIGDGCQTELSTIGGHVTITGGTVNATGGSSGAGIGGIFDCSVETVSYTHLPPD